MVNIVCDTGCGFDTSLALPLKAALDTSNFLHLSWGGTRILAIYPRRRNAVSSTGFFLKVYTFWGVYVVGPPPY